MARRSLLTKNLDVLGPDQEPIIGHTKGAARELIGACVLSSLCPSGAQPRKQLERRHRYRASGTRYIAETQASNIMEAVAFAKSSGLPLVAHLTIHWSLTDAGDDPDGALFAKVREGLSKWLRRRSIKFAAAWARERQSGGQSDVVHCHLLFHLPGEYRAGARLLQLEAAIYRLIKRHGRDYWHEGVIKLVIHDNPDGKYLIKGGGPKVWKRFNLRKEHRRSQGIIHGKRCGTTQNIGPAARRLAVTNGDSVEVA